MSLTSAKWTLLLSSTLTVMSGATIAASLPQMAIVFNANPQALFLSKLVLTLPAIFIVFSSPVFGRLSDKLGRIKILNVCLILYAISGVSGFFFNDFYSILVGRAFLGIAVGGISTMIVTLVGDMFESKEREGFISLQSAFMSMGGVCFIFVGGILAHLNWKLPFLIYSLSIPILILSLISLRSTASHKTVVREKTSVKLFKPLIGIYLIIFLSMAIFYLIPTQVPFLLESKGYTNPSLAGLVIAVSSFASVIASLNFKKIKQKLSAKAIFYLLFTLIAVGYFALSRSNTFIQILLSLVVSGLGVGLILPNVNTYLLKIAPDKIRGSATGILTACLFAGQFSSPIIIDTLTNTTISANFEIVSISIIIIMFPVVFFQFRNKEARL